LNRPSDMAAREKIQFDLDTTFLVEAGAGSGKTTSLVGRMLQLIRSGQAVMSEIAAITFTNKASDELRERFRLALERENSKGSSGSGEEQERIEIALRHMDQCFIGTIHAFCGMMLRERPVESGLDPAFIELDDEQEKAFQAVCWEDYLLQLRITGQERQLEELLQLGVDVITLRCAYECVSLFSDVHIVTDPSVQKPDFDRIRLSLFPLAEDAYAYIPSTEPEKGWDVLQKLVRETKQHGKYRSIEDEFAMLRMARRFERKLSVTQNRWTDKNKAKELCDRFQEWQIQVLLPFLEDWREYLYPKLIHFVLPAVHYSKQRRQKAGLVSFQDLLEKATDMLREHADVRSCFAKRYRRLLIDEFQDTDPIQAEMMFLLAGDEGKADIKDWRRLEPRPGSLFIVGDPKQSIYRFRRADISIYNEVKEKVAACGELLTLSSNFRSIDAIGQFVNETFAAKLPPSATEEQAGFVRMGTQRPDPLPDDATEYGVRSLMYPKITGGKQKVAEADAERVAAYISWACSNGHLRIQEQDAHTRQWVYRDAVPGDFLILLKTKEFLHVYEEELDRYGIPADTAGSAALYKEMLVIAELTAVLQDSTDHVALLAVLRGLLFGISDRALYAYRQEGHNFSYDEAPELSKCSAAAKPVAEALLILKQYMDWTTQLPAMAALLKILEDCVVLTYAAAQEAGATRAGSILRLLHLLQDQPEAVGSWSALSERLRQSVQGKGLETMSLLAGGSGAVRIMNLHKAKGLEAPVVFLACPCGESDHDAKQYINRMSSPAEGYFTITKKLYQFQEEVIAQPPGWTAMSERERLYMNAERDRLLYVAATRAKQLLVISLYPDQPDLCPWSPLVKSEDEQVPELVMMEQAPLPRQIYTGDPQLEELERSLTDRREAISQVSYKRVSVTALTKNAGVAPEWSAEGRGQAFGSLVHRCLEMIGTGAVDAAELEEYMSYLAEQEGVALEWIPVAAAMIRQVTEGELWQRSLNAKQRLHEVSLHLLKETKNASAANEEQAEQLYVRGIIDYVFEEEDGWVIVDFKTDVFESEQEADFVRFYRPQVQVYAEEWSRTFGCSVKETGLYFLQHQKYVPL